MISKVYWRVGLAALISIYAIACSDQGSSNSSNDSDRSNETRTIETDNGTVTIRRDPNDEDVRIIDSDLSFNDTDSSSSEIRIDCGNRSTVTDSTYQFGDIQISDDDVCK